MPNQPLKSAWEKRAEEKGNSLSSVLFQGLPDTLNKYIHEFHWKVICNEFLPHMQQGSTIIDLGCGYGRLSYQIKDLRSDLAITGTDFSLNYCQMYRRAVDTDIVCSDINQLPFAPCSFDGLIAVTSMMYTDPKSRQDIFKKTMSIVKPGGYAIFIDPGEEFKKLLSIIKPAIAKRSTGGDGFTSGEYRNLVRETGNRLINHGGMPVFSIILPILLLLGNFPNLQKKLLNLIAGIDPFLSRLDIFTVHRWMVIQKNHDSVFSDK